MSKEILIALISALVAFIGALLSYLFSKWREREAELRKEKLEHYKEFAIGLSGVVGGESTDANQKAFALACNKLNLVAPQTVLEALQAFQNSIKPGGAAASNLDLHDELLSHLYAEMRKDLKMSPSDSKSFRVGLWSAGKSSSLKEKRR